MVRIIAKVVGLSVRYRVAHLKRLLYEECVEALSSEFAPPLPSTDPLRDFYSSLVFVTFHPQLADKLVSHAGELCEVEVENGVIVNVKPFKREREIIEEARRIREKRLQSL